MDALPPDQTDRPATTPFAAWDDRFAGGLDAAGQLLYRSNLLGGDLAVTNFGGGNTSAKLTETDPLTKTPVEVLWVKGSGGDLGSMRRDGFATLYQEKLLALEALYRGPAHEDEMVGLLDHCRFGLNPRPPSIDTPLHAYLPFKHIDHMHPDAVIAIAAARGSEALTRRVFGGEMGWLPWKRPGFALALALRDLVRAQPGLRGIVLAGHGMFTWGQTSRACYETTVEMIGRAQAHIDAHGKPAPFGAMRTPPLPGTARRAAAATAMRVLRPLVSAAAPKVGHFDDSASVLEFVGAEALAAFAAQGTSCPDHFLRTKMLPLVIEADPAAADFPARVEAALDGYRHDYRAYYAQHAAPDSPAIRDDNPVIVLLPGIGMATFAKSATEARIAGEFYRNAIQVMRGAAALDAYQGLDPAEAFRIEYWALEEAKLKRQPPAKPLAGRVAYVSGAASGIGRAVAERLLREGAAVMLTDRNGTALAETETALAAAFGPDPIRSAVCDVTDESAVEASFAALDASFGGIDILVSSAGIAASASIGETSLALWQRNIDVLATGYFLVARAAFGRMGRIGGSIIFVGSKNGLAASANAAAYCSAKAAELHLARCLALEGGPLGIRVNTVNPDAVIRGSAIWSSDWKRERAAAYGIEEDALEDYYAQRSLLKRSVLPEDVAEAVLFFAGDASAKSTGNIVNVDGGNPASFVR